MVPRARLAQSVEHQTFNLRVKGSSPLLGAVFTLTKEGPLEFCKPFLPLKPGQGSSVAQWKRAGPITQRSMDRNHPLLDFFLSIGGSLSFTSPCFPLQIQNRPCWFKNGTDTTLCHYPLIAQLVERRTVVGIVMQISLGRWFESGSRDYFLKDLISEIPVFLFREGAKRKAKICPG